MARAAQLLVHHYPFIEAVAWVNRTVDLHLAVGDDGLDLALLLEVLDALAGEGAVDLHSVDQDSDGDEAVRLDILVQLLGDGLVEDDGVLGLVLDLALRPLLLLLLCSSSGRLLISITSASLHSDPVFNHGRQRRRW
jgi:hypothetical protein